MKIAIIRHFKVDYKPKKMMNSYYFEKYIKEYDEANVIKNEINIEEDKYYKCYCSDIERAYITANEVYKGTIEQTNLLREVQMYPIFNTKLKLPAFFWSISSRICWMFNGKSQLETKQKTIERAKEFISKIDFDNDILIVSHGFFLITLINQLKEIGFKGDVPRKMENGTLYILER